MTSVNKAIILCAKIFAALIIAGIISSAVSLVGLLSPADDELSIQDTVYRIYGAEISSLDIELSSAQLIIQSGDMLAVTVSNEDKLLIVEEKDNGKLKIREKNQLQINKNLVVTVKVPDKLNVVDIDTGAGKVSIGKITADRFYLNVGAGNVEIHELNAKAEINGGVGDVSIRSGAIHDLDLDFGVGNISVTAELTGEADIDCGMGNLDLTLINGAVRNRIVCDVGLGSFKVNGDKVKNSQVIGHGANSIDIDGGIGNVSVSFADVITTEEITAN